MEQAVEQHHVESKTFEVKMNQALNKNERLLEQVMSKDIVNLIVNSSMDFASVNVHECEKCLKLETELQKDFSVEISDLNACLQEKVLVITTLKDELRKLKGKDLANNEVTHHPSDPEINTEPITPKLLNKRSAHSAYIKHTQEEAAVLRDLVDHIQANYPLDPTLESALKWCMLSDNHDLCVLDYINNVNARAKSKSAKKHIKRKVWKPTGKMFTTIGYIWRPTVRTFTSHRKCVAL
ncbi:hypothetical protein Tco_1070364 [Tanacetum coccineum]|uniref:Uncharacterized protein n=1 Tax=Tanacetum coccineum TaxID=301880 RepID=A0ABQ5HN18_9ASTR